MVWSTHVDKSTPSKSAPVVLFNKVCVRVYRWEIHLVICKHLIFSIQKHTIGIDINRITTTKIVEKRRKKTIVMKATVAFMQIATNWRIQWIFDSSLIQWEWGLQLFKVMCSYVRRFILHYIKLSNSLTWTLERKIIIVSNEPIITKRQSRK